MTVVGAAKRFRRADSVSLGLAAAAAILLVVSFPPWNVWPLAWFAPTPLYVALHRARNGGVAGLNGWVFGVILFLAGAYWMLQLGSPPWAMLAFIEAVPFGIVAAFCRLVGRRPRAPGGPVVFAAAWVTGEWLRGLGRLAFPWFLLAASQVRGPRPSLQILTITGQWGLSFTIALTAAIIGEIWLEGRVMADHKPLAARLALAAGIPISLFGFGLIHPAHLPDTGAQPFVVATLQGNVTKEAIENGTADSYRALVMGTYRDMTRETAAGAVRPDLIVWPETVVPGFLLRDAGLYAEVSDLARATAVPLLVGTVDIDPANNLLNTAAYFDAAGNFKDRYDKVQIVPIGEYFPLRSLLGSIYKQYGVPDQDMVAGRRSGLMTLPAASGPITTGAMICYDDVFTTQARARVRGGAEALVLITSDQTFGTTAGPQQHADLDVLRAVETDRYLVRAGATGPSEVVCPDGEIQSLLPIDRKGVLRRTIYSVRGETCFVRAGDYLPVICLAGCVLAALAAIWRQATKAG